MESGPPSAERDARLLGLALLHGYVEAEQLQRAAETGSSPARILAELRRTGALDEPCLEGLEQALRSFQPGPAPGNTGSTHMEPPRHVSATAGDPPAEAAAWDDDSGRWNSGARLLRQFTVEQWKHYRNLRFIGEGGMGRIYRAQDPDLKRTVALKFLRGQEPGQLKRFLFEAQAQALMDHPNICRVYEISEWQGQHYIAMQYVNGPTLLRAAPGLALDEKLRIAGTVAEAVHAAHRRGLIHRDLKPANVLLEQDERNGFKPYVLDFGLARELEAPGLTASGLVLGTTAYISPEQARGEAHHVDRRTDIYGLGATLYELFAGAPPFGEAQGLDCLRRVVDEEPPPLRSLAPQLPKDLETVVMKCLEKDPARRYDDAQSLAEDLRRVRDGEPIQARRTRLSYRIQRYAKRNRAVVGISGLALLSVVILAGLAGYARITASVRERHVQHFSQQAERIEAQIRFAKLAPVQDIEPHEAACRERLGQLQAQVQASGRLAEGPGAYAIGRALLALGDADRALPYLKRAEASGQRSPELAYALGRCYGYVYQRQLDQARSIEDAEERSARILDFEQQWKRPALEYFLQSKGASAEPQEYLEALVETFGGKLEIALEKAAAAAARNPLWYESWRLQGQILLALAQRREDGPEARDLLRRAAASFDAARIIAPSDAELWQEDAKVHRELTRQARDLREGSVQLAACREAAGHYLEIRPSDQSPCLQVAWSIAFQANRYPVPKEDPEPLIREGLAQAGKLLAQRPADPEGLGAKTYLLEILGQAQDARGADPGESFQQAFATARDGLERNPNDPTLLSWALQSAQALLVHQGGLGTDIESTWSRARDWAERFRALYPERPFAYFRHASLYIERAEIGRRQGQDPRPWLEAALEACRAAERLGREQARMYFVRANVHLIRGQFDLAQGRDARADLEQAVHDYEKGLATSMQRGMDPGGLAECLLYCGLAELAQGRDPSTWIHRAEAAVSAGFRLSEEWGLYLLRGQCHWVRARWALQVRQPAKAEFGRAEADLATAGRNGRSAEVQRWMAKVRLDKVAARLGGAGDLAAGIAAARRAIQLEPRSSEAQVLLADLLQAQSRPRPR